MWLPDQDEQLDLSQIQTHLLQLLNTRQGSLAYLPDYGMPDLNEVYQQLPESLSFLIEAVKKLIERYEPRLSHVVILPYFSDTIDCVVHLQLQAVHSVQSRVFFETYFLSGGEAKINWRNEWQSQT